MKLRVLLALLLGVLALAAVGCGGDDSSSSAADDASTISSDDGSSDTGSDDVDLDDIDLGDLSGECKDFALAATKMSEAISGGSSFNADESVEFFEGLVEAAPDDLKTEFELYADAFAKLGELDLEGIDLTSGATPTPEQLAKLEELGKVFDDPSLQAAGEKISAWMEENCKTG